VLRLVASQGEGVDTLVDALDRHQAYLAASGRLRERRRQRLRERVMEVVELQLRTRLWRDGETRAWLDAQLPAVEAGEVAPFAVADALRARSGELLTGPVARPVRGGRDARRGLHELRRRGRAAVHGA
jgi:LAO/AO transport system kinase